MAEVSPLKKQLTEMGVTGPVYFPLFSTWARYIAAAYDLVDLLRQENKEVVIDDFSSSFCSLQEQSMTPWFWDFLKLRRPSQIAADRVAKTMRLSLGLEINNKKLKAAWTFGQPNCDLARWIPASKAMRVKQNARAVKSAFAEINALRPVPVDFVQMNEVLLDFLIKRFEQIKDEIFATCKRNSIKSIFIYNPRFLGEYASLRVAEDLHIPAFFYEQGGVSESLIALFASHPFDEEMWIGLASEWAAANRTSLIARKSIITKFKNEATVEKWQEKSNQGPERLDDCFVFFLSGVDEFYLFPENPLNLWNFQLTELERFATILKNVSSSKLFVKPHPRTVHHPKIVRDELLKRINLIKGIDGVLPNRLDSYSLIERIRGVVIFHSTIGVEAALRGIPTLFFSRTNPPLCLGRAVYASDDEVITRWILKPYLDTRGDDRIFPSFIANQGHELAGKGQDVAFEWAKYRASHRIRFAILGLLDRIKRKMIVRWPFVRIGPVSD
jgi:hypothetical protein